MPILGLASTETVSGQRWTNIRRKVFYEYPNGSAPLIGILSLMKEEETNDPEYSWWEKRLKEQTTTVMYEKTGTNTIAFYKTAGTLVGATCPTPALVLADGNITFNNAATTAYGVCVNDASLFRNGHIIRFKAYLAATGYTEIIGRVVYVLTSAAAIIAAGGTAGALATGLIAFQFLRSNPIGAGVTLSGAVDYDNTNNLAQEVQVIGSAFPQGVTDLTTECYYLPINPGNYTQIFRTPFSFTGSALVTPVKFDDTGIYKDKAKQHSIDHMIEMELAFIFGHKYRNATNVANATTPVATTGVGLPLYTTGGIVGTFLDAWELGDTAATALYGFGYGNAAVTNTSDAAHDADDHARIIRNTSGTINEKMYDTYLERLFRTTSNTSNEKLVLCGSGFLKVMNQMYRSQSTFVFYPPSGDTFGLEIVAHKTSFGTIYYKTHPLFSRNAALRYNALFLDVHSLRYRNMSKRDTQLLKNRQPPDADYRKDEWFTEAGLELRMPESFMYLQNVQDYAP